MSTRRTFLGAGVTLAAGAALTGGEASAAASPPATLSLPAPTGPWPVGVRDLHLVDRSRRDPLAPSTRDRELMVRLWYPAVVGRQPVARYLPPGVGALLVGQLNALGGTSYPDDLLTFPAHARVHAAAASGRGRPVVLFSPGRSTNVAFYTALCEDLASRGYVVAGLDHTFDAVVEFPGGRIEVPPPDLPDDVLLPVRVADMRFVLDRLAALVGPAGVAAVGHSLGSRTAVGAVDRDRRIGAGAALDGNPLGAASLRRPFLLLGNQGHRRADDPDWAAFYDRLRGPRRYLVVDGAGHYDLSDVAVFKMLTGLDAFFDVGPINGFRALTVVRTYVAAWLAYTLCGRQSPLLRGESSAFPEVDFE